MPQWAGSCWYYLRYLDPDNDDAFIDPEVERYWMVPEDAAPGEGGVDLYIGGVEHAVLHLLYARFWHKVLFDLGHVSTKEPFRRLFNQGYILADAFTDERGMYVTADDVIEEADGTSTYKGEPVTRRAGKMGKSLKNSVSPDDIYATYGADTLRLYEMAMGPLDVSRPWRTNDIVGVHRFLQRLWRSMVDEETGQLAVTDAPLSPETAHRLHRAIKVVRGDFGELRFNTAIAELIGLTGHAAKIAGEAGGLPRQLAEPLVLMVAPLAPHIAEELWCRLGHSESLTYAAFPEADETLAADATVTMPVQVNGKVRFTIEVPASADEDGIEHELRSTRGTGSRARGPGSRSARHRARPDRQHRDQIVRSSRNGMRQHVAISLTGKALYRLGKFEPGPTAAPPVRGLALTAIFRDSDAPRTARIGTLTGTLCPCSSSQCLVTATSHGPVGGPCARPMPARDEERAAEPPSHQPRTLQRQLPYFAQSAPLIGRAAELAEVTGLLSDPAVRLVTITGRSGVGKTRLALEAARLLDSKGARSVDFVSLAPISDPDLVLPAIAAQLEVSAGLGTPLNDVVVRWLRRVPRVLALDNFEHLLAAADHIFKVLDACPQLQLLVTSQAPLRLAAERVVDLAPLALPELLTAGPAEIAEQPAVALYCDRARAANHLFRLEPANTKAVVELCRELEGLPLAIELAAARATTLPAADLANRLTRRRLDVLHSPRPDAPARHHDMRAAIGWTYNLLTDFQRRLLRRLSVAGGAFDIDDAEALADGDLTDVLDSLSALVDFHLITPASADGLARFELAPSIRDFAVEELASAGEADEIEERWVGHLASRARAAAEGLCAQAPDAWWIWLEGEHDCLRNALQKCLDAGRVEPALDLVSGLAPYWDSHAANSAHSLLLDRTIELAAEADSQSAAAAEVLLWSGLMGIRVLVTDSADQYVERLKRGEELARRLADDRLIMLAANCRIQTTMMTGDVERAVQANAEGLEIARRRGEPSWISRFGLHTARWAQATGDYDRAVRLSLAALADARRAADSRAILNAALVLQTLAPASPAAAAALPPPQELLTMARAAHQKLSEAVLLPVLAVQSLAAGDVPAAAAWCAAALDISGFDPTSYPAGYALFASAEIAARHGDHEFAARIHGRLQETRSRLHAAMSPNFVTANLAAVEEARTRLGEDAFDAAVAAGTGWAWEAAVAEVSDYLRTLAQQTATAKETSGPPGYPALTDRQRQVIQQLATGRTNKEIAAQLGLTPKTVMHHTVAIYQRLGVRGRSEAVAWAIQAGVAPAGRR